MIFFFLKRLFTWFLIIQYSSLSFAQTTGGRVVFELKDDSTANLRSNNKRIYRLHVKEEGSQSDTLRTKLEWDNYLKKTHEKENKSFPIKTTYQGESLRVSYSSEGNELKFLIDSQGGVLIDYMKGRGNFSFLTFGQINLKKTLSAEVLDLKGSQIRNESHLNVDALCLEATDTTKRKDDPIINWAHGIITAQRKIDVIKGDFNNQGGIRSQGNLVIDLHGNNLTNNDCQHQPNGIVSSAGLALVNAGELKNLGTIKANTLHVSATSLINGGKEVAKTTSSSVPRKYIYKTGVISSETADIKADTLENNLASQILATNSGYIQTRKNLHNKGFIGEEKPNSTWVIGSEGSITNDGKLQAEWLTLEALGLLRNNHQIEGRSFLDLSGGSLSNSNKGRITGQQKLQLSDFSKVDNFGVIKGDKIANLLNLGAVNNQGTIDCSSAVLNFKARSLTTDGLIHARIAFMDLENELLARNLIKAENLLRIKAGRLINKTTLSGSNIVISTHEQFENHNAIVSQNELKMTLAGKSVNDGKLEAGTDISLTTYGTFTNHKNITLTSGKKFIIEGTGTFANHATIIADVFSILSMGEVSNNGTIKGKTGTWTIGDLTNTKIIDFTNTLNLTLTKGSNSGDLTANTLTILIHQLLTNTGELKATTAFTMKGDGQFTNKNKVESTNQLTFEDLAKVTNAAGMIVGKDVSFVTVGTVDNQSTVKSHQSLELTELRKLLNSGTIHAQTGTWTINYLNNSKNIIIGELLTLATKTGINSGELTAKDFNFTLEEWFINNKLLRAKRQLTIKGPGELTNTSNLESEDILNLESLGKLINQADIKGKTGTWTVGDLTNTKIINFTDELNLTLTTGSNSDDLSANILTILIHQLLTNTGALKATTALTVKGAGEFRNDKTVLSSNQLSFEGLAKVVNTNEIDGNNIDFTAVGNLENQAKIHANSKISFKNLTKLANTPTGLIRGNMGLALESVKEGDNEGKIESSGLLSVSNTHFNNAPQAHILARNGVNIDPHSSIINEGLVNTGGLLSGNLEQTFRQNQGTWSHTGFVDPLSHELQLNGITVWQIAAGETEGQTSQQPLKIINNGEAFFRNGGLQAKGPLQVVNNKKLTLSGAKAQRFQSLINHKDLHLEADTENSYREWSITSNADQSVSFTPVTSGMMATNAGNSSSFINNGTLHTPLNLTYHLQSPFGKADVKGDLEYLNRTISLEELLGLSCNGTVTANIAGGRLVGNAHISTIHHLNLRCNQPLTIVSELKVPALTLASTAPIKLGEGHQFAHIQTTEGNLILSAPSIIAPVVKLDSAADLDIKTPAGSMKLGDFVEKTPDEAKKLGPWGGGVTMNDHFQPTGENTYRASNGSILNAGRRLNLEGQRLDVSYCILFSQLETKITSSMPLNLLSIILNGHGDLRIQAPQIKFNFAGTKKAQRTTDYQALERKGWFNFVTVTKQKNIAYDYLVSEPTKLLHQGDVYLNGQQIDFVGTPFTFKKIHINGQTYDEKTIPPFSAVRLIPILLGEKDRDHYYTTLKYHKVSGGYLNRSEKNAQRTITFASVARDLAPMPPLPQIKDFPPGVGGGIAYVFTLIMLTNPYGGFFGFGKKLKKRIPGFYGEFDVPNATVAEIDALGRYESSIWMANEIRRCHQTGDVFRYWSGPAITPKFVFDEAEINIANFQGQMTMDGTDVSVNASTIDLYNSSTRQIDEVLKALDIDLGNTPQAVFLDFVQNSLGHGLVGHHLSISDLPAVTFMALSPKDKMGQPIGIRLSRINLHVPIDLVVMAAMADHAKRVHYRGMSGEDLLMHIMNHSRRLRQLQYASSSPKALAYEEMAADNQLALYAANDNDPDSEDGKVYLHIPVNAQNRHSQPGDLVIENAKLNAANDNTLRDQRLVVGQEASLTGKNLTLESTAKPSTQNNVVTYTPHAPMTAIGDPLAKLTLDAGHTSRLTGTTVEGFSDIKNKAGVATETTALKMKNKNNGFEGNTTTHTVEDHHLLTTIKSPGTCTEIAPEHIHEGTLYQASVNQFVGKKAKAKSVVDYTNTTTKEIKSSWCKTTQTTSHTQTPTSASQPTYRNITILDVDTYEGEGAVFQGITYDRTKLMTLKPAIATALSTFETNSDWLGVTSGVKVDQGQEQMIQPRIEGEFISTRHEKDADNILHLTSTILNLHKSQIDKDVRKDTYQLRNWYHEETTGNAPIVGTVVSLLVAVTTWGVGTALAEAFIQNAVLQAMATASFVTVCSSTAASIVTHQGDLGKVTKDLFSAGMLKNVALSAATAGIMKGLQAKFPALNAKGGLQQRFMYHMVRNSVQLHLDIALNGGSYEKLAKSAGLQAAVSAMGGYLSNEIGNLLEDGDIDRLSHKLFHGAVGALASTAMGEKPAAGALGAMVAETVAEIVQDTKLPELERRFEKKADEWRQVSPDGRLSAAQEVLWRQDFDKAYDRLKEDCANIGRYAAIGAAVLAKQNPSAVYDAANTALTENFVKHGLKALRIAGLTLSGYEIIDAYRTEGPEAALYKLGEIGLITVAIGVGGKITYEIGGIACQNAVRAWDLACKQYPTLWKITQTIYQGVDGVKNSGLYQKGAALIDKGMTVATSTDVYQAVSNNKAIQGVGKVIDAADSVVEGALQLGGHVATKGIKYLTGGGVKEAVGGRTTQLGRNLETGQLEQKGKDRLHASRSSSSSSVEGKSSAKNVANYERYKTELRREEELRNRIISGDKTPLKKEENTELLGFKGNNPRVKDINKNTGKIELHTDSTQSASSLYRQQVRQFEQEGIHGQSVTRRFITENNKSALETKFDSGSRVGIRSEGKSGQPKVDIKDIYRNIEEKITVHLPKGE
ncbi:DUF637 domain-containing protein [Candidatus Paracaedibacter symbiosus]|uniref:DUF637 domain-containing protein n=1 Tax=Candidatus Paracaedibacter symbiosus TaxID=244582 RepID=UPI000509B037|nr:DUF637 domain-containing protein [Candidatus Paracaedibacter symbiosus]